MVYYSEYFNKDVSTISKRDAEKRLWDLIDRLTADKDDEERRVTFEDVATYMASLKK